MSATEAFRPEMPLRVAGYEPDDEAAIVALYEEVFPTPVPAAGWRWRFLDNPAAHRLGPAYRVPARLAWDGDRLAGAYSVTPVTVEWSGVSHEAVLSVHTMTRAAYRGRGLLARLAGDLYEALARDGWWMVYGFPNRYSHRLLVTKLGWRDVYEVPMLAIDPGAPGVPSAFAPEVREMAAFGPAFDLLWSRARPPGMAARRDAEYLRWRFGRCPLGSYATFGFHDGDDLLGYAVVKPYLSDQADLVDLLVVDDPQVGRALVAHALAWAAARGRRRLNAWMNRSHPLHWTMEQAGFANDAPVTYMCVRPLAGGAEPALRDFDCWYLTMADSDVF